MCQLYEWKIVSINGVQIRAEDTYFHEAVITSEKTIIVPTKENVLYTNIVTVSYHNSY